jgi:hypothetical protein
MYGKKPYILSVHRLSRAVDDVMGGPLRKRTIKPIDGATSRKVFFRLSTRPKGPTKSPAPALSEKDGVGLFAYHLVVNDGGTPPNGRTVPVLMVILRWKPMVLRDAYFKTAPSAFIESPIGGVCCRVVVSCEQGCVAVIEVVTILIEDHCG